MPERITELSTQLQIYNIALQHLGLQPIQSLTENTPSANNLNNVYVQCRDDVFAAAKWVFATVKEVLLSSSDTAFELEWSYVYAYPTNNVAAIWEVYNSSTATNKHEQDFETGYLTASAGMVVGSDLSDAYCEYTTIVTDTTLYSPKYVLALSYYLAATTSHVLIGDAQKGLTLMEIYGAMVSEAKRLNSGKRKKKPKQTSSYRAAR